MQTNVAFTKKTEAEIWEVRVKLLELQAKAKKENPELRSKYIKHLDIIEKQVEDATIRLRNVAWLENYTGEQLKDKTENSVSPFARKH